MYEPEQLRTFLAVAQTLSFTRAAESLGIRQPTVSQHVRRLEEAVGRPLFVRDTRSVTLTSDGEAMAGFAREIIAAQQRAVGYFTGSHLAGRLRFGVTDDLALTPLPRILRDFRQLYPRIDLELAVLQNDSLIRRIESGHLDVAFVKRSAGTPTPTRDRSSVATTSCGWAPTAPGSIPSNRCRSSSTRRPACRARSASRPWRRPVAAAASRAPCAGSTGSWLPSVPDSASRSWPAP